jgi:nitrite reductase/ring-hydroxylating ferredoxin subunit
VASNEALREGTPLLITVDGEDVALFRVGDEVFALEDLCSHAEASLSEGEQSGYCITCPQHGGRFDVRTGKATHFPAFSPVRRFDIRIEGNDIMLAR